MATYQAYWPWDGQTMANFNTWAQGIGTAMAAIGLKKVKDPGTVDWTLVPTAQSQYPGILVPKPATYQFKGAWVTGTQYSGTSTNNGTNDIVTNGGFTYMATNSITRFVLSQVGVVGAVTTYTGTITGGGSNGYVGHSFTVAGFANGGNNVTFVCTASTATTLVCVTSTQVNETLAATASCVPTQIVSQPTAPIWIPYYYEIFKMDDLRNPTQALSQVSVSGQIATYTLNGATSNYAVGQAVTIAGFAGAGNNGTFPVIAATGNASFQVQLAGQTNETLAATVYDTQFPIYIKIAYFNSSGTPTGQNQSPDVNMTIGTTLGTGISSGLAGTVQGNLFNSGGAPPEFVLQGAGSLLATTVLYENNFQSSDGGPFSLQLWRDPSFSANSARTLTLTVDRSRDSAGNTLAAYALVTLTCLNSLSKAQLLFKPGTGGVLPAAGWAACWPTIAATNQSWSVGGSILARPIFPLPGYVGNPCLQGIVVFGNDVAEGMLINVVLYGSSHTYLITKNNGSLGDGLGSCGFGIRWE